MNDDFKKAMQNVRPLDQDKHRHDTPRPKPRRHKQIDRHTMPPPDLDYALMNQTHWIGGEETASFQRPGLQPKQFQKLRRGALIPQAQLDLHQMTGGEALLAIEQFILHCEAENLRKLLIVHGKGQRNPEKKPILKNILIEDLRQRSNVLAFHSAVPRDGGTGALYVLLTKR